MGILNRFFGRKKIPEKELGKEMTLSENLKEIKTKVSIIKGIVKKSRSWRSPEGEIEILAAFAELSDICDHLTGIVSSIEKIEEKNIALIYGDIEGTIKKIAATINEILKGFRDSPYFYPLEDDADRLQKNLWAKCASLELAMSSKKDLLNHIQKITTLFSNFVDAVEKRAKRAARSYK